MYRLVNFCENCALSYSNSMVNKSVITEKGSILTLVLVLIIEFLKEMDVM